MCKADLVPCLEQIQVPWNVKREEMVANPGRGEWMNRTEQKLGAHVKEEGKTEKGFAVFCLTRGDNCT